jgi:ATP-dependent RNA helicase RhlE
MYTELVELEELEQMEKLSLFSPDETTFLRDIEKLIGLKIPTENIAGFEPDPKASTQPIKQGQGRQQRNSTPRQPKTDPNRSGNNSFGPRRNNDRRSN